MGYTINQKPVIPAGAVANKPAAPSEPQQEPQGSSNRQFGMPDVPEQEKHKQITHDELMQKLNAGELMYGPLPQFPSFDAFDGIKFDYCDGLRLYVPKSEDGTVKQYFVNIIDHKFGVVLHSAVVTSDNYITTRQKFYTEMSFTIIKQTPLPQQFIDDLKKDTGVTDDAYIDQIFSLTKVPDITEDLVVKEFFTKHPDLMSNDGVINAIKAIFAYTSANLIFSHRFDTKDKEVMVQLPVGTIGDSVGWFAYMERFQKKTQAKIICVMNPAISVLFKEQYPDITFIEPKETINYKPYACYKIGLFFKGNTTDQPYDFRYIGNHRTASKILDVNDDDIAPRVDLSAPRMIQEPYVCIAVQASAYCKLWTNPTGWHDVIRQLKDLGYRVLCIDKETVTGQGIALNHMPWGVEDFTGNRPLQERINLLKDCDFFIGLSSGVSWLAWCAQCPVVMISGFTNPFNEFYTPYRVINTLFCHGCWNDERCDFDHYDYMWCPRHKGTEQAYECSKTISSKYVINVISQIPAYQKRVRAVQNEKLAVKANDYITETCYKDATGDVQQYRTADAELIEQVRLEHEGGASIADIAGRVKLPEHCIEFIISNSKLEK